MNRLLPWTLTALALLTVGAAADLSVKDGGGTTRTIFNYVCFTTKLCNATVLIKSDGTEVGISSAPLRVDPTGTTPQPVSGTFWPYTLGQQVAGSSVPIVLPADQLVTLTPPAAITGFATSVKQSDGSHKTQIVDGAGSVIASTSNNLNVQCANCSGSGVSTADAASFTASTSLFAGTGGFFQTTATANPLTNGQQGMWQMTANRAGFVNLRDTAGTAIGTSAAEVFVGGRGTAGSAAGGVLTVQGSASGTAIPVSIATVPSHAVTNAGTFATQAAVTAASGSYASGAFASGSMVDLGAIADAAVTAGATGSVSAKLRSISRDVMTTNTWAGGTLGAMANYGTSPGAVLAPGVNAFVTNTLAPGQAALASSSPVAIAKNSGTGSTVAGAAVGTAGTASTEVVTVQGIAAGTVIPTSPTPYPATAVPYTATATGTTGATTATLAGAASVTTYICGFSIRANATAAATGNATVTGVITATMNFTQWTAPNASGLGITEMIFSPCVPASGTNQSVAVVSAAPGTGGVVSVTAWGYKL